MSKPLTYGLTHLALVVGDIDATITFYDAVFGLRLMHRDKGFGQVQTIGSNDIIVFEEDKMKASQIGKSGGILHFGFRLRKEEDLDEMEKRIIKAGGKIIEKGEFCPGEPYLFFKDPNGYVVEIWHEIEQS